MAKSTKPAADAAETKPEQIDPITPPDEVPAPTPVETTPPPVEAPVSSPAGTATPETVTITKAQWDETQRMLNMLYQAADKGRIFNLENQQANKEPLKVKLSKYNDSFIIGWRTVKDQSVFHPTTGKQVGEEQEYEILLRDKDGKVTAMSIKGYPSFSEARYTERVDCTVIAKKEDMQGNWTYDIQLPDGQVIPLDSRFVN
jgi:hypothetical protein